METEQINEAEIEEHAEMEENISEKASGKSILVEFVLIFILGLLLGMVIKTEATKRITMGYSDYKLADVRNDYNFAQIEKDLMEKAQQDVSENVVPSTPENQ